MSRIAITAAAFGAKKGVPNAASLIGAAVTATLILRLSPPCSMVSDAAWRPDETRQ
jgi:hypothetical protein